MYSRITGLITGLIFGAGLSIGGMTDPARVLGFLDIFGQWDATLAFVMGGALVTTSLGYRWVLKRPAPLFGDSFHLPKRTDIDLPLVGGAGLFGIGWGLVGYCPGPALASLAAGQTGTLMFVVAMVLGLILGGYGRQKFISV